MKIIKIDYKNPDPEVIKKVAHAINKGKLAIVPGDAVYTLVADATDSEAIKKVQKVKKRDRNKAFNLGLYKLEDIAKYGEFNALIYIIQKAFPHEPFTFVVPRKLKVLPKFLNPNYKSLGFRIPFNKVTSTLSKFHRTPVIGTSANISELRDTYSIRELMEYFRGIFGHEIKPDIVLDAGKLPVRRPSTVIEIINSKVKVIREGEIKTSFLEKEIMKLVNDFEKKLWGKE
jgi:L-threonylcarbamoyladenylate synthase